MRALNRKDWRDLIVLLTTLVVMTILLRAVVWHLTSYDVDPQTGMLVSSLTLLLLMHYRVRARLSRRIRAAWSRVASRTRAA